MGGYPLNIASFLSECTQGDSGVLQWPHRQWEMNSDHPFQGPPSISDPPGVKLMTLFCFWYISWTSGDLYLDYVKKLKAKAFLHWGQSLFLLDNTALISGTLPVKIYGVCQLTLSCTWPFACPDLWLPPRFWFLKHVTSGQKKKKKIPKFWDSLSQIFLWPLTKVFKKKALKTHTHNQKAKKCIWEEISNKL